MAKAADKKAQDSEVIPEELLDLFEGMSPEEIAEILALTGQSLNTGMDRTPTVKVNKYPVEDEKGKSVKMGNFVIGQIAKEEGEDTKIDDIGIDLGPNPEITVLKYGYQYSYFSKKGRDQSCKSQIVLEAGEKPIGDNLGHQCDDKTCPRRQRKEGDSDDKKKEYCSCRYIVFIEVAVPNEEGGTTPTKAIMYFKGESFLPFKKYVENAGKRPLFGYPTKLNTQRKINGSNIYWIISPELLITSPYPDFKQTLLTRCEEIKLIGHNVREFEKARAQANSNKDRKALPPGTSVEPPPTGTKSSSDTHRASGAELTDAEYEDITF